MGLGGPILIRTFASRIVKETNLKFWDAEGNVKLLMQCGETDIEEHNAELKPIWPPDHWSNDFVRKV